MRTPIGATLRILPVLILLAGAALQGGSPSSRTPKSATGCSRVDGASPTVLGCYNSSGICYACQYSYPGGWSDCSESPDGTIRLCIDYQN